MWAGTNSNRWMWPLALVTLFAASGATCNRTWLPTFPTAGSSAPVLLNEGASVAQIAAAVNQNSARVQSLSAPYATITIPDAGALLPSLRGNLVLERPQRFRLTAGTGLSGQEVDLGVNDERFWLWVKRNQPPAVYYCHHEQFARSAAHQLLPIEPRWLHSALGLVELDPVSVYQGPTPRGDGTLEVRAYLPSATGSLHRVLVIDSTRGLVREQHVYDTTGQQLIASAVIHSHRYHEAAQASLPEKVTIRLPSTQMAFTIELGEVQINQPLANSPQTWTMPTFEGYPQIDLGTAPATMPLPVGAFGLGQNVGAAHAPRPTAIGQLATGPTAAPVDPVQAPRRGLFGRRFAPAFAERLPVLNRWRNENVAAPMQSGVQPASYQPAPR